MTMPRTQAGINMLRTEELHTGRCRDAAGLGTGCFCGVGEAIAAIEREASPNGYAPDVLDRLMELWELPWSEERYGEAQVLLSRIRRKEAEA